MASSKATPAPLRMIRASAEGPLGISRLTRRANPMSTICFARPAEPPSRTRCWKKPSVGVGNRKRQSARRTCLPPPAAEPSDTFRKKLSNFFCSLILYDSGGRFGLEMLTKTAPDCMAQENWASGQRSLRARFQSRGLSVGYEFGVPLQEWSHNSFHMLLQEAASRRIIEGVDHLKGDDIPYEKLL